jgi:hypothetical protein
VLLKSNLHHNHEISVVNNRQTVAYSIKRKATEKVITRPLKLIRNQVQSITALDLKLNDVHSIRREALIILVEKHYHHYRKVHTPLNNFDTNIYKSENLLLLYYNMVNICFSTKTSLEFLCSCDKIFVDGTFEFCSKYLYQIFTVHDLKIGYFILLINCNKLSNKLSSAYEYLY